MGCVCPWAVSGYEKPQCTDNSIWTTLVNAWEWISSEVVTELWNKELHQEILPVHTDMLSILYGRIVGQILRVRYLFCLQRASLEQIVFQFSFIFL